VTTVYRDQSRTTATEDHREYCPVRWLVPLKLCTPAARDTSAGGPEARRHGIFGQQESKRSELVTRAHGPARAESGVNSRKSRAQRAESQV